MLNAEAIQQIAAEAEQSDWDNDVTAALTNPTVSTLTELTTHPERMAKVGDALAGYQPGHRAYNLQSAAMLSNALNGGNTKVALSILLDRRKAMQSAGHERDDIGNLKGIGPQTTEVTDMLLRDIRSGAPERLTKAKGIAGMVVTTSLHPEDVPDALARMGFEDDRTEEAAPDPDSTGEKEA